MLILNQYFIKKSVLLFVFFTLYLCIQIKAQSGLPKLEDRDSWTMIILPDPQTYIKFDYNQPAFNLMTQWIKNNKEGLNIELVLCEGDLVEQNNIPVGDGVNGNQNSVQQWTAVREAFSVLDTIVPYILCAGNHDYGSKSAENRYSQFNSYFPPGEIGSNREILAGMIPNFSGENTLENAYYDFTSPHGIKYLIMSLEFNARDTVVAQAKEIMSRIEYNKHKGIILTHSYMKAMSEGNALIEKEGYALKDVNHGKDLWKKLIAPSMNIEMVFSGHIGGTDHFEQNVGYRNDKNAGDKEVHQMVFNAQTAGGGWHGNGGDGWLRILEFLPDGQTVIVKTFSPFFAFSPATIDKAWRNESFDYFRFQLAD